jgi:AcrR family transcriptional regulator
MKPSERKELILAGAIDYFAEYGFTGKTRELSDRLGITQPLLYRYFPSKQVLMEEVFEIIFLDSWRTDWDALIRDESTPLIKRLTHFYQQYFEDSFSMRWIRVYLHSGLAGTGLNKKYLRMIRQRLIDPVCISMRAHFGPKLEWGAISDAEREFVWMLHGSFFAYATRKYIFDHDTKIDFDGYLARAIENFLDGAKANYPKLQQITVNN